MKPAPRREQAKGRPLDPAADAALATLFGPAPLARDRLIEHLHAIQDRFGGLRPSHLRALAERMRLPEVEIFEVASFYHHFDLVPDEAPAAAPVTIRICDSVACQLAGAEALLAATEAGADPASIRVVRASCLGACDRAPAAMVGRHPVGDAEAGGLISRALAGTTEPALPASRDLAVYRAGGGYAQLERLRSGGLPLESALKEIEESGLRGLGGAGFPTARKWRIVRAQPGPRFLTVNADEGEPGTFKDRAILEGDPHRLLEGALIAAHAVEASRIYLYLRDEYPAAHAILAREIAALEADGAVPGGYFELRRGAGAYICGAPAHCSLMLKWCHLSWRYHQSLSYCLCKVLRILYPSCSF